jgi:hypothetical protein
MFCFDERPELFPFRGEPEINELLGETWAVRRSVAG